MGLFRAFVKFNRAVSYWIAHRFPNIFAEPGPNYREAFLKKVEHDVLTERPSTILEAGGADRPILGRNSRYTFVGLDVEEHPDCSVLYDESLVQSIEDPIPEPVSMIVSFTLLEHVPNNKASVRSIFNGLTAGGTTHHYIPSGLHPYSLATRVVGHKLQRELIPILRPGSENVTGYPAFFHLCTPRAMVDAFRDEGFVEVEVHTFFRATDYFAFFTPLFIFVAFFENICRVLRIRQFASGFILSARKPPEYDGSL